MPIPIAVFFPPPDPIPNVIASWAYPFKYASINPEITVSSAAHLKKNKAEGAITFPIAGFCSSGI